MTFISTSPVRHLHLTRQVFFFFSLWGGEEGRERGGGVNALVGSPPASSSFTTTPPTFSATGTATRNTYECTRTRLRAHTHAHIPVHMRTPQPHRLFTCHRLRTWERLKHGRCSPLRKVNLQVHIYGDVGVGRAIVVCIDVLTAHCCVVPI